MKHIARFLTLTMLCAVFARAINVTAVDKDPKDFRAVFVSTVYNLDYPSATTTNASSLKAQATKILDECEQMGMNAIVLQVRPASDSFYPSSVFPWSKYLTGKQGTAPGSHFDPLQYWINQAHSRGIELHAWVNPYRVANSLSEYNAMVDSHPAKVHPEWVVFHTDGKVYFNPGIPEVQQLVLSGIQEIVDNYNVDGIHLDDYFYPGTEFDDATTYEQYGQYFDNIEDWRRDNVNVLIKKAGQICRAKGKEFGVSPAGVWANRSSNSLGSNTNGYETYYQAYADSRRWVKESWIDYICPQIYWEIGNKSTDYKTLVNWWADVTKGTGVKLYIGMADYRAGSTTSGSWKDGQPIKDALTYNKSVSEVKGEIHFRYQFLEDNIELNRYYKRLAGNLSDGPGLDKVNHGAYMVGTDGQFLPEKTLTRAEAATILARLVVDEDGNAMFDANKSYSVSFGDVSKSAWYAPYIGFMQQLGLILGYEDGNYRPQKEVSRAEFTVMLSRFEQFTPSGGSGFDDVSSQHWAAPYIAYATKQGYIKGYEDGTFRPDNPVSRAETVTMVNRVLGRQPDTDQLHQAAGLFSDVSESHWAYGQILEASYKHNYTTENGKEVWAKSLIQPFGKEYNFVSDKINFIIPDATIQDELYPLKLSNIDAIALHHMDHPTAGFYEIEKWHLEKGWAMFAYNFFVDFEGNVWVGRGWNQAAGVGGNNGHIISVGFQGDYETNPTTMPKAQFDAGVELIKWIEGKVPSVEEVGGHGDYVATLCPGQYFPLDEMVAAAGK